MKFLLFFTLIFNTLLFSEDEIINDTDKQMLCVVSYPAKYEQEIIHGIDQRVQVQKEDSFTTILQPNETLLRKTDGNVICYNELTRISAYKDRVNKQTDINSLDQHLKNHEIFDINSYINENREFIEAKYGTGMENQCKNYKDGEYCTLRNGLDILYNKEGRVKKIFIYGSSLFELKGNLALEADSFSKIRANNEPLGLWISEKNKKIIKSKPSFESDNVILWKNPSNGIQSIVMTSKDGHMAINGYSRGNINKEVNLQNYLQAIEIEYVLDDKAYAIYQKLRPMPKNTEFNVSNRQPRRDLPIKAKTTWGEYLNQKNIIPTNMFKAFYINTNNPKEVISSEEVKKISMNYNSNQFHNIDSKDFGGYWVGNFTYEKEEQMQISISQSWAKTRIIIDDMIIYEGGTNEQIPYTFTKGKHKIEVEYVNNWHTVSFKVSIKNKEKVFTSNEIKKELNEHTSKNSEVVFVGAYESSKKDQSITLKIAKHSKPIVLVLNSYDSVEWIIQNPQNVKIEAVIYSAYKSGVEVSGDISKSIPIFAHKDSIGSYSMEKKCQCINGGAVFHCDGSNAIDSINAIETITGKKMFGFSTKYGADTLMVPNIIVDEKKKKELNEELEKIELQRQGCQSKSNPEFENIFDKK
ncbi:hypothetical protein [Sulfurimonas sp.]|uniref:hypothetical protein n=1 Tax=Sulfurimonas sp. TaxID=2022749 RepID=UPI00286DEE3B|nr:hypothetical protein [Sulfurimonas sp.]